MLTEGGDSNKVIIIPHALEDVQLLIQPARVKRVEDLRKHKCIEHQRLHNSVVVVV